MISNLKSEDWKNRSPKCRGLRGNDDKERDFHREREKGREKVKLFLLLLSEEEEEDESMSFVFKMPTPDFCSFFFCFLLAISVFWI